MPATSLCLSNLPSDIIRNILRIALHSGTLNLANRRRAISPRWHALALECLRKYEGLPVIRSLRWARNFYDSPFLTIRIDRSCLEYFGLETWRLRPGVTRNEAVSACSTGAKQMIRLWSYRYFTFLSIPHFSETVRFLRQYMHRYQEIAVHSGTIFMNIKETSQLIARMSKMFGGCQRIEKLELDMGDHPEEQIMEIMRDSLNGTQIEELTYDALPMDPDHYSTLLEIIRESKVKRLVLNASNETNIRSPDFFVDAVQLIESIVNTVKGEDCYAAYCFSGNYRIAQ